MKHGFTRIHPKRIDGNCNTANRRDAIVNATEIGSHLNRTVVGPLKTEYVGRGEVIVGWDQVLKQMKAGEKRLVIIPPELAYGTRGQPPKIGRNATLVFEMELVELTKE